MTTIAPRPRLRGLTAEAVFIGRSLRHALRDAESMLMSIALPVLMMLMFTYVFGGAIDPSGGYVDYVVPGTILTCAGFGAATTATFVANDMTGGIIDRIRTMPLRPGAVLTGHVVASLTRNLRQRLHSSGSAPSPSSHCGSSRSPTCSRRSGSRPDPPRPRAVTASSSCSCRTSRAASCPPTPCRTGCASSPRYSPLRPSSRRCARCWWEPTRAGPRSSQSRGASESSSWRPSGAPGSSATRREGARARLLNRRRGAAD